MGLTNRPCAEFCSKAVLDHASQRGSLFTYWREGARSRPLAVVATSLCGVESWQFAGTGA